MPPDDASIEERLHQVAARIRERARQARETEEDEPGVPVPAPLPAAIPPPAHWQDAAESRGEHEEAHDG